MELTIKADNAQDMAQKITSLAQLMGGPREMHVTMNMPSPGRPSTEEAPKKNKVTKPVEQAPTPAPQPEIPENAEIMMPHVEHLVNQPMPAASPESDSMVEFTVDQLNDKLRQVISKCGGGYARTLMETKQWANVGSIPKERHAEFITLCDEYIVKYNRKKLTEEAAKKDAATNAAKNPKRR